MSKTANVSVVIAKQMLAGKEVCILKAKAPQIKTAITKLQGLRIAFYVDPLFKY